MNLFIVFEENRWLQDLNANFTLKDCLLEVVELFKNTDPDKYSYSGYGFGCNSRPIFFTSMF